MEMSHITDNSVLIIVSTYFIYIIFIIYLIMSHNRTHYYELIESEEIDLEKGDIEGSEDEISEDSIINNEYF